MNSMDRLSRTFGFLAVVACLASIAMGYFAIWVADDRWGATATLTFFIAVLLWVGNIITSRADI